jgi:hypothetical protein
MSQFIHEIVLQEFIIENILLLDLNIKYKNAHHKLVEARFNKTGTFWDLEGKLDNGVWLPVEVEWISENFDAHKHRKSESFNAFIKKKGVLIVLRKNKEIEYIQQYAVLDTIPHKKFELLFSYWFKKKSRDYSVNTLNEFLVGNYKRKLPRILVIPVSENARRNYFSMEPLYRKFSNNPLVLGFKENGYYNNEFVQDIQPGDICLFLDSDGIRTPRSTFIQKIKKKQIVIKKLVAFKITSKLFQIKNSKNKLDELYWPDEIKKKELIYPYRCRLADHPFIKIENTLMPFMEDYTEEKWELLRSCIQYGAYFEMSSNDFIGLISNVEIS